MRTRRINQVFLLIVCLYLIGAAAAGFFLPGFVSSSEGSVLTAQALILAGSLIGCRMLRVRPVSHMRLRPAGLRTMLSGMLCTAALYPFLVLVSALMRIWFKSGTDAITDLLSEGNPLRNLLIFALIPACVEEVMNRGLLYRAYRQALGARRAVILSALLFGLFHMNLDQFAYTFVFGVFLCLVMEAADSLWACIACHFALNALSVLAAYFSRDALSAVLQTAGSVPIASCAAIGMILLAAAVVCIGLFRLMLRFSGRRQAFREAFSSSAQKHGRIVSVELVLSVGICILYMAAYELIM